MEKSVLLQSEFSDVYTYYYSYEGEFTLTNLLLALKGKYPVAIEYIVHKISQWFTKNFLSSSITHFGACHGDELALLFKLNGLYEIKPGHKDYQMSKDLVKLWSDFARNE